MNSLYSDFFQRHRLRSTIESFSLIFQIVFTFGNYYGCCVEITRLEFIIFLVQGWPIVSSDGLAQYGKF
jgi:hypothetical protein